MCQFSLVGRVQFGSLKVIEIRKDVKVKGAKAEIVAYLRKHKELKRSTLRMT